mgnify:CR=1 FL=1
MTKKSFLIPVALAVTALFTSSDSNKSEAAVDENNKIIIDENINGSLLMKPVLDKNLMHLSGHSSHSSHGSHGSHGSHSSHYSGS